MRRMTVMKKFEILVIKEGVREMTEVKEDMREMEK